MFKTNPNDQDDSHIVSQIIDGKEGAFDSLLQRHGGFVEAIVKKHVPFESVEDTIQEVFLRVYRSLPTFRNESSLRHWLSVIATRTCYDYWREHYKSKELPISSLTEQHQAWLDEALAEERDMSLQAKALRKEAGEILDIALNSLSAGDKMVVELVYLEEYSLKEAAKLLGWTVANVKVRLFRSRKKLHKLLTSRDKDEGSKT